MATISTTTNTAPFQYPNYSLLERDLSTGYLYAMVKASTANNYVVFRSTDNGGSWASFATLVRASIAEIGSIIIHHQGYLHWIYRTGESNEDRIYYRRLVLSTATWGSELLVSFGANGGVTGSVYQGLDHQWLEHGGSTGHHGLIVAGQTSGSTHGVRLFGVYSPGWIGSGTPVLSNGLINGSRSFLNTGSGRVGPSVDVDHNGNSVTSTGHHMWITWGRTALRAAKMAWNGSGWTQPSSSITIASSIAATDWIAGRWDGARFIMVARGSTTDTVVLYERNSSNTSTTTRTSGAHPAGAIRACSLNYNSVSRDTRAFAVGTSNNDLYYADYIRASATWSGWTTVSTTDILGANVDNWGVRKSTYGNAKHDAYTAHSGAPNTLVHTALSLSYAPLVPTWNFVGVSYVNGGAREIAGSVPLNWDFNDSDPLDTQSAFAVRRQIGAGALNYWRASDSTWQVAEVKNVSASSNMSLPAAWGLDADAAHSYWVKVWDSTDIASAYSDVLVLIPSTKSNPTITSPADGGVVTSDTVTVTWTVGQQSAYRVETIIFGFVLKDSGWITGTETSYVSPERLADALSYSVRVTTKNNEGLASDSDTNSFSVDYIEPAVPTLVATPQPTLGYISVAVTNPGNPTFVSAGTVSHAVNASVTPGMPAGMATGDLMLVLSMIRNSGTGVPVVPTDYTSLILFGNVLLSGKIHDGSESAPVCAFTGGVANADTSAQMCAFRDAGISVVGTPATLLNGAGTTVPYPALTVANANGIVLAIGWKQTTHAGVAALAGMTEIGEGSTATGDDQSFAWDYVIQTAAANIASGSFAFGGASTISRGIVIALSGRPTVATNEVFRLVTGAPLTEGVRVGVDVAPNGTVNDFRAVSGVDYSYRVKAVGDTNTSTYGAWTV